MSIGKFPGRALTLVVNPSARHGRARSTLPAVCKTLTRGTHQVDLRVIETSTYEAARQACQDVVDTARYHDDGTCLDGLLVQGGDGMAHLGINACVTTAVPLGIIPAGTGNDFARGIGIAPQPLKAAEVVLAGHTRRIDLMRVTNLDDGLQRYVGAILSSGFDAHVNARANKMTWPHGSLRYAASTLSTISAFEPISYQLRIDGRPRKLDAMFMCVGNTGYFGGGMKVLPNYSIDDGLLDITIAHPVSRASLLRLLPQIYSGRFIHDPAIEMLKAKTVEISGERLVPMADGEMCGTAPLRAEAIASCLTVFAPVGIPE